jgi:plastocyanin
LRKLFIAGIAVLSAAGIGGGLALAGSTAAGNATVKTIAADKIAINKYLQIGDHFAPGTVSVKSGGTLTFTYGTRDQEPHTLTIVQAAQLPKTLAQVESCAACRLALGHLKNPKAPPDQNNPIVHWTLNKGQAGLDEAGDSIAIQPGAHKTIKAIVSAPAGTTLSFVCALHPWMQGKIVVTS